MKKQKILAYEGRIPVSDRELTAAVIDIDNKKASDNRPLYRWDNKVQNGSE